MARGSLRQEDPRNLKAGRTGVPTPPASRASLGVRLVKEGPPPCLGPPASPSSTPFSYDTELHCPPYGSTLMLIFVTLEYLTKYGDKNCHSFPMSVLHGDKVRR